MVRVVEHLSVAELEARYEASGDVTSSRHFQTIWLLAKGHVGEVAEMTSFGQRWIEQLVARYNAEGPDAAGRFAPAQWRRREGAQAGVVAKASGSFEGTAPRRRPVDERQGRAFIARELGLEKVAVQRGWEALKAFGMSIQTPRPKNPKSATPEEAAL